MQRRIGGLLLLALALGGPASAQEARTLARRAYQTIREHPFERAHLESALEMLTRAEALDPREPFLLVAAGGLIIATAYHSGDWWDARSFDRAGFPRAASLFERALSADPSLVEAHLELAWLAVLDRDWTKAQHEYLVAYRLEPENFHVWLGQAVCWWKQGNAKKADLAAAGAEARAQTTRHRVLLNNHRERRARFRRDLAEQEDALKDNVTLTPDSPWAHGNYAGFLLEQGRLEEAVREYERAVALGSYPIAERGLAEARRRRASAAK